MNKQLSQSQPKQSTNNYYIPRNYARKKFLEYDKALQLDFEEFLNEFEALSTFNYEQFAQLWVQHKMSLIFIGWSKIEELGYLVQHSLICAKKYVIYSNKINVQVGAFYLLYGLFFKQPIKDLIRIRITKNELNKFQELFIEMKELKQTDFLFIYNKLINAHAFNYVYTEMNLGPDIALKQTELVNNIFPDDPMHVIKLFKDINEDLNKIEDTSKEYEEVLKEFKGDNCKIAKIPITIKQDIDHILSQYNNRKSENVAKDEGPSTSQRNVKDKAFTKKIDGFRAEKSKD